jgi:hypothetical protein
VRIPQFVFTKRFVLNVVFILIICSLVQIVEAQLAPVTPGERFFVEELKSTFDIDFQDYSDPKDRTIRSEFLASAIFNSSGNKFIAKNGLLLSKAIIKGHLEINNKEIPITLRFSDCDFPDGVDFSYDRFADDLTFINSHIGPVTQPTEDSTDRSTRFIGIRVAGTLDLSNSTFYDDVDFTHAEISNELRSVAVTFASKNEADFTGLTTKWRALFKDSTFAGGLTLNDADVYSVEIASPLPKSGFDLDMSLARIGHGFKILDATLTDFEAEHLVANSPTLLENVIPSGQMNLRNSHFQDLNIVGLQQWLAEGNPEEFLLEGFSFDDLGLSENGKDQPPIKLLDLIKFPRSRYSPQPYLELEKFLRSHGDPDEADQVYIEMRRQERGHLFWARWPADWLLDISVGYGKRPWRSGIVALAFVIFGAFVFRRERMQCEESVATKLGEQKPAAEMGGENKSANAKPHTDWYNRFWFSLDQFSPIDLGISKKWVAKEPAWRNYAQVHRVAGWILIPLILAAITGLLK